MLNSISSLERRRATYHGGNISWGQHIMGTDNSIVDKSEKDEMMNNFSEEKNEKTDSEVNDDATNIDGDTDDMIEEKDYCNYP